MHNQPTREHGHHAEGDHGRGKTASEPDPTLEKDTVCGMMVNPATTKYRAAYGDRTFYFCSGGCLSKFTADPARYAAGNAAGGEKQP